MFESDSEEDEYQDNSRDAQLARALQDEENKRSDLVSTEPQTSFETGRRGRSRKSNLTETDFTAYLSEEEDVFNRPSKKTKISDAKGKKPAFVVPDSEVESEFSDDSSFVDEDEDEDEDEEPDFTPIMNVSAVGPSRRPVRPRQHVRTARTPRGRITRQSQSVPTNEVVDNIDYGNLDVESDVPNIAGMTWQERREYSLASRAKASRKRLESHHPEIVTMWRDLEDLPKIPPTKAEQPANISRELKPFQLEGLNWMKMMEKTKWGGGLLGDEMGMGKTIQAVSLIMSDYPAKSPSLVLIPPVALMQWQQEIAQYTDGTLKTFVYHGTNSATKGVTVAALKKYDVILMSYNSLESLYRFQEKGRKRKDEIAFQKSPIHQIQFHRVILDEAHNIKVSIYHVFHQLQVMSCDLQFLATYYRMC